MIAVLEIAGVLCQQSAGNVGTLSAMRYALVKTAYCYGTLSVKGVSACFNASAAAVRLLIFASGAMKSAH